MENFKSSVPAPLQAKMRELAQAILSDWDRMVNVRECIISPEDIGEIEGNSRSGWVPFQDGGFTVSGYYQNDEDSSYHFTEKQTEYAHEQAKNCFESFLSDNGLDSETQWDDLTEEQREELYDYEREWNDEALLQYEIFCNGYGWRDEGQTVTVRVSVNYKDAPYYRSKYAEDIKSTSYSVEEFLSLPIAELLEAFTV